MTRLSLNPCKIHRRGSVVLDSNYYRSINLPVVQDLEVVYFMICHHFNTACFWLSGLVFVRTIFVCIKIFDGKVSKINKETLPWTDSQWLFSATELVFWVSTKWPSWRQVYAFTGSGHNDGFYSLFKYEDWFRKHFVTITMRAHFSTGSVESKEKTSN